MVDADDVLLGGDLLADILAVATPWHTDYCRGFALRHGGNYEMGRWRVSPLCFVHHPRFGGGSGIGDR